jgi:acyl-CoA reductase-like NAD-dependent aldehyde dehydrogenase
MFAPLALDPGISRPTSVFLDGRPKGLMIGGMWRSAADGATLDSTDPTTGRVLAQVAAGRAEDVNLAVAAARSAFQSPSWADISPYQRSLLLLDIAKIIEAHAEELAILESLDMGGPLWMTRWMVNHCVEVFRHYAGWPTRLYGQTAASVPGQFHYTVRQPLGVVAAICAWNGPLLQLSWKVAPALATGNTVVVKPSQQTPLTALRFAELLLATDLPPGVFNLVTGTGQTAGQALITHEGVNKISFTGSTSVGKQLLEASAGNLKRVTLELGGKSPSIVFPDADLKAATKGVAAGFCQGSGQSCVAGSRIFVHESINEEFTAQLIKEVRAYTAGDPFHPDVRMGPLVSHEHLRRVASYFDIARAAGASLLTGGTAETGLFVEPTLISNVTNDMRIAQEEIFGPVAVMMTFKDIDEVVALANDTIYGLAATIWTKDLATAHRMAARLEAGTVWVNTFGEMTAGTLPFGGFKQSGIGREHGTDVIDAFTEIKTVIMNL